MYICTVLSSHSSFSEFLLLWAIVDNVAMNVGVIISVQVPAFNSFRIAELHGDSVLYSAKPPY